MFLIESRDIHCFQPAKQFKVVINDLEYLDNMFTNITLISLVKLVF